VKELNINDFVLNQEQFQKTSIGGHTYFKKHKFRTEYVVIISENNIVHDLWNNGNVFPLEGIGIYFNPNLIKK
jgi:hypothetical protein